jgi:hypothetical protein
MISSFFLIFYISLFFFSLRVHLIFQLVVGLQERMTVRVDVHVNRNVFTIHSTVFFSLCGEVCVDLRFALTAQSHNLSESGKTVKRHNVLRNVKSQNCETI